MADPTSTTDDVGELIGDIYGAVGDVELWRRLNERLTMAALHPPEIETHLEVARRAHEEHLRLLGRIETFESVYDQLALGVLVVDRAGSLVRANHTATYLMAERDGLELVDNGVHARDPQDDAHLQKAIMEAATCAGEHADPDMPIVCVARPDKRPLSVLAVRSTSPTFRFSDNRLTVTLVVIDPDRAVVPGETLRALYGFTPREVEFAILLMQGLSVKDAASVLRVSTTTARTFLAQVTAKTDSHSQAELMVRLLAIPRMQG